MRSLKLSLILLQFSVSLSSSISSILRKRQKVDNTELTRVYGSPRNLKSLRSSLKRNPRLGSSTIKQDSNVSTMMSKKSPRREELSHFYNIAKSILMPKTKDIEGKGCVDEGRVVDSFPTKYSRTIDGSKGRTIQRSNVSPRESHLRQFRFQKLNSVEESDCEATSLSPQNDRAMENSLLNRPVSTRPDFLENHVYSTSREQKSKSNFLSRTVINENLGFRFTKGQQLTSYNILGNKRDHDKAKNRYVSESLDSNNNPLNEN